MDLEELDEGETPDEDETQPVNKLDRTVQIIWGIILGLFLVTLCAGTVFLFLRLTASPETAAPTFPAGYQSAINLATPTPITKKLIRLPVILSGGVSVQGATPVWKVTNIEKQGYKLGGRRYELATFMRADNQATAQGYCINPGWDIPAVGSEYLLTAGDIFVPVDEPKPNTIQRFARIK